MSTAVSCLHIHSSLLQHWEKKTGGNLETSLSFGKVKGLLSTAFPVFFPSILLLLEVTVSKMKNVRQSQKKMLESKMFFVRLWGGFG